MGFEYRAKRKFLVVSCSIAVLTAALLTPHVGTAATFSADSVGLFQGGGIDSDTASGPTPVTVSSSVSNSNGTIHSTSQTERGYMRLYGSVSAVASKGTSGTFGGMFIEFTDLQIRRIDGTPSSDNVAATFQYFTTFNASWSGSPVSISDRSDFVVAAQITQPATSFSFSANDSYSKMYSGANTGTPGAESLAGTLQAGTPFTLRISYGANGLSAGTGKSGQYEQAVNVGSGPSGAGPVFLLPAGFTVDSAEMGLFNNQWQGIPEPSSLALLAMGLFTLRRQTRR